MGRTFSNVDYKLEEADFFLKHIEGCGHDFFGVRFYVSAFSSSARSVTFALQSCLSGTEEFAEWYAQKQAELRTNKLARFFHEFRRINEHVGDNLVGGGTGGPRERIRHWFLPSADVPWVPQQDVESACAEYFRIVLTLVFECYERFGPEVDSHQRYTSEYFSRIGKSIEDAEEELGFPRGWTDIGKPDLIEYRWQMLREATPGCEINHLFQEYLKKVMPAPPELPELELQKEEGWHTLPDGTEVRLPPEWPRTGDIELDWKAYVEAKGHVRLKTSEGSIQLIFDSAERENV